MVTIRFSINCDWSTCNWKVPLPCLTTGLWVSENVIFVKEATEHIMSVLIFPSSSSHITASSSLITILVPISKPLCFCHETLHVICSCSVSPTEMFLSLLLDVWSLLATVSQEASVTKLPYLPVYPPTISHLSLAATSTSGSTATCWPPHCSPH